MFGIGVPELILILIVAVIAIGPDRLPELAKALGKAYVEFRRAGEELKKSINLQDVAQARPTRGEHVEEAAKAGAELQPDKDSAPQEASGKPGPQKPASGPEKKTVKKAT